MRRGQTRDIEHRGCCNDRLIEHSEHVMIVSAWNDAFALEAFFNELSRRAAALGRKERAELEARIETARELMGGKDSVDRFLRWKLPPAVIPDDEDAGADDDRVNRVEDDD